MYLSNDPSFSTNAIHIGSESERWKNRDVIPPICLATTYEHDLPPDHKGLIYTRYKNPTRDCLEACLAKLEDTKHCLVFSSGCAAITAITKLLKKGGHAIVQKDVFYGTQNLFRELDSGTDEIDITFVDATEPENVKKALRPNTKLAWIETPTNPLLKMTDIRAVTKILKENDPSTIVVCDNTFLSPYFQRPSNLGVDIVMHSCSKYIGGHSDVLMGALCTNDENLYQALLKLQIHTGPTSSSFDCYLALRSLKTLEVRMQRHGSNSQLLAEFLEGHPMIEKVFHPGLASHPQHELALRQCYGHSGIFSFYVKNHDLKTSRKVLQKLRVIKIADSLGSVETTIKMPSRMPANSLSAEQMETQGITDGLFRVSVGLENPQDLISDLKQALKDD